MELILIFVLVIIIMMWFTSRSQRKQAESRQQALNALEPGSWVMTQSGFMGRLVDIDGEVAIVQTVDGHEVYWLKQVLTPIDLPPFAPDDASTDDDAPADEADDQVEKPAEEADAPADTADTDVKTDDTDNGEETPEEDSKK